MTTPPENNIIKTMTKRIEESDDAIPTHTPNATEMIAANKQPDPLIEEYVEKLDKHETLHTGNCYCEEDERCNSMERLKSFFRNTLTTLHQKHQEEMRRAVEAERERMIEDVFKLMGSLNIDTNRHNLVVALTKYENL